jgi:hypothetical protein
MLVIQLLRRASTKSTRDEAIVSPPVHGVPYFFAFGQRAPAGVIDFARKLSVGGSLVVSLLLACPPLGCDRLG